MKKKKRKQGIIHRLDWVSLKAEFLASNETLNEFRLSRKLASTHFYMKSQGWKEEREELKQRALERVKRKIESRYEKFVDQQKTLLEIANHQVMANFKRTMDKTGKLIQHPCKPFELIDLVNSIHSALKAFRLMEGKATGDETDNNYWLQLISYVQGETPQIPPRYQQILEAAAQPEPVAATPPAVQNDSPAL